VSAENVERHREIYRGMNGRDADRVVAVCDPGVEIRSMFAAVGGAVYHGHDGIRAWQRDLAESWSGEFRVEVEAYFDLGERTLAFAQIHGRGEQSGIEVAMPGLAIAEWRDGRCVSHRAYPDREAALRELNVPEDKLDPIEP
jgi:ketosteroid isomerase-like protein